MSEEFSIQPNIGAGLRIFFHSQLFCTPPYPTQSFANQTVIVTGSNTGLGFEAARHFYRLNCRRLILAVRTISKGQTAKEDIVRSVKHRSDAEVIEVWPLDLNNTKSTLDFAERVKKELPRLDVLVENAGINHTARSVSEGFEQTIQVNVINTFLLALSLLPKLRETKTLFPDSSPHLVITSSEAYRLSTFKEINAPDLYQKLNEEKDYNGQEWYVLNYNHSIFVLLFFLFISFRLISCSFNRYQISKLLEVLFVRELVSRLKSTNSPEPDVTIDLINPGLCKSNLSSENEKSFPINVIFFVLMSLLARSTEVGSRTIVHGASAGQASHGMFMSDGKNQDLEGWIYTDVGKRAQLKVFEQTMKILEAKKPGVWKAIGV